MGAVFFSFEVCKEEFFPFLFGHNRTPPAGAGGLMEWLILHLCGWFFSFPHQIQCINISLPFEIFGSIPEENLVMLSKSNLL